MMNPLSSPRIRTPRGSTSPRQFSNTDWLYVGFLRHFKWLIAAVLGIAVLRLGISPATSKSGMFQLNTSKSTSSSNSQDYFHDAPVLSPTTIKITSTNTSSKDKASNDNKTRIRSSSKSSPSQDQNAEKEIDDETVKPVSVNENNAATATITEQLQRFNASFAPVIESLSIQQIKPMVQIHFIIDLTSESGVVDPPSKFMLDGIERSPLLRLNAVTFVRQYENQPPPLSTIYMHSSINHTMPFVYLIDWGSMNRDCHRLQLILETIQSQQQQQHQHVIDLYYLLMDFTGSSRRTKCDYLFDKRDETSKHRIRLAKRNIVQDRYYDHDTKQINPGTLIPNAWQEYDNELPILHTPLPLRETFAMAVQNITKGKPIEEWNSRQIDVGYFWNTGDYSHYTFYRRDVAKVIKTLHHSKIKSKYIMENHVGLSYTDKKGMVENTIQYQYVWDLLLCKIVVITQRDEYEDTYRLMESLATGALVMIDPMIALPSGLIDKVNIVVYENESHLKQLIRHYLEPEHEKERKRIALEGYKVAMGRHRCWHRLEELLFGRPITNVDNPDLPPPEKEERPENMYTIVSEPASGSFL